MNAISRRSFLGNTAGVLSAASLTSIGAAALRSATAQAQPAERTKPKDIRVGMLTAPLSDLPLVQVLDVAKRCDIAALEVVSEPGHKHIDPMTFSPAQADTLLPQLGNRGLEISSLCNYMNTTAPGKAREVQQILMKMIDVAALLGVPTICTMVGMPVDGMSKLETIKKVVPEVFRPVLDHAKEKRIKVAVENWFATCLQGLDTFDCLLETIPDEHFGLNFDPSHLVHQQCDYRIPVAKYGKRIFHTHAKDCLIDEPRRAYVGVLGEGWWRYVIPGYGAVRWGEYISHLREVGYRGVLSIEHEDSTFGPEEGFRQGAHYLNQFCKG